MKHLTKNNHQIRRIPQVHAKFHGLSNDGQSTQLSHPALDPDFKTIVALIFEAVNDSRQWYRILNAIVSREALAGGGLIIRDNRLNTDCVSIAVSGNKSRHYSRPSRRKTSEKQLRTLLRKEACADFKLFSGGKGELAATIEEPSHSCNQNSLIGRFFVQANIEIYIWFYIPERRYCNVDSLVARVSALLPTIIGAYRQHANNQNSCWQIDSLSQLLDQFEKAVLLVDSRRRIIRANARGHHCFSSGLLQARDNIVFLRQADTQSYAKALKKLFHRNLSSRTWRESFIALEASGSRNLVQLIPTPHLGSPDNEQYLAAHLMVINSLESTHPEFENTIKLLAVNFDLNAGEQEAVLKFIDRIHTARSDRNCDVEVEQPGAEIDFQSALAKLKLANRYQLLLLLQTMKFNLRLPPGSASDPWT